MSLNRRITDWKGLHLWVVGASSGIGMALARALLQAGADVAVSARTAAPLRALMQEFPGRVLALPMDVSREEDWQQAYAAFQQWRTGLDLLIFCAADYQPVRAWTLDTQLASRMIDVNLKGAIYGVSTVLGDMLANTGGGIAITASVAGYVGLPKSLIYGPTKAALINFCESLYLDVHERGVAVSVINPGFVATPLTANNDFKMPALITAEEAAREIMRGLEAGEFEIHFPKRFTGWLKALRQLPYSLQFRALKKMADQP